MAGKYRAYPEYKFSGFEWLGDVPEQWNVISLKQKFRIVGGSTPKSDQEVFWDGEFIWVTPSDLSKLPSFLIDDSQRKITLNGLNSCGTTLVPKNSIILSTRAPIGSLAIANVELCTNQGCKSLVPLNGLSSKFIAYLLSVSTSELNIRGKGTTFLELSGDELGSFKIPFPSENEQRKIANFLDHETAKIDTLIEKQQQLIKLLKEKRQAVISHAVTKGLNPNAPMRDSGVEWLGKVPAHWGNIPLKLIIHTRKGVAFKSDDFCETGIRVVKASDIKNKTILATDVFLPNNFLKEYPKALLSCGDIILSTVGSNPDVKNSAVGQIGMVPEELGGSLLNQNAVVFDLEEAKVLREYLFYILQTEGYRDHLDLHAHGTANQSSLNIQDMLDFNICFPEIDEQRQICAYLTHQQQMISNLEVKAGDAEKLLKERRTALISAVVTGKIDVRNWQAPAL